MLNSVLTLVLVNMVDGFLMGYIALKLFGVKFNYKRLLLFAAVYGTCVFTVRKIYLAFEIPFGTHTYILLVICAILLYLIGKVPFYFAVPGALIPFILTKLASPLTIKLIDFLRLDINEVLGNAWLLIPLSYTEFAYMIAVAIFLKVSKVNVVNVLNLNR